MCACTKEGWPDENTAYGAVWGQQHTIFRVLLELTNTAPAALYLYRDKCHRDTDVNAKCLMTHSRDASREVRLCRIKWHAANGRTDWLVYPMCGRTSTNQNRSLLLLFFLFLRSRQLWYPVAHRSRRLLSLALLITDQAEEKAKDEKTRGWEKPSGAPVPTEDDLRSSCTNNDRGTKLSDRTAF